jgi:hypothetical protein
VSGPSAAINDADKAEEQARRGPLGFTTRQITNAYRVHKPDQFVFFIVVVVIAH